MCRLLATFSYDAVGAANFSRAVFVRLTAIRRRGEVQSAIVRHAVAHTQMGGDNAYLFLDGAKICVSISFLAPVEACYSVYLC